MNHPLRTAAAVLGITACFSAAAQNTVRYPERPIRMIAPSSPGGPNDVIARAVSTPMAEFLGKQIVIDNRAGAAGLIGTEIVAKAIPDGYTLLFGFSGPLSIVPNLVKSVPYDPVRDFAHISLVAASPYVLLAHPSLPVKSVKELVALAKAQPGKLNFGSSGTGTQFHLSGELLKLLAGINIVHVPYKGTALVYPEMFSGSIQILFDVPVVALPFIKQGRVRPLGVSGKKRINVLPEVPTIVEAGIAGYDADLWFGLFAPTKVPTERLGRVQTEVLKALASNEVRERFAALGADGVGSTPAAFAAFLKAENEKWEKVVKASGAKID